MLNLARLDIAKILNLNAFTGYNRSRFFSDISAGFVVAIIALPLAIAFGIASGLSPQQGIIAGVISSIIVALFGGTNVQVAGPTGSFIFIALNTVNNYGFEGLAVATILAGVIVVCMGLLKLGDWMRFMSTPIIVGFTAGLALNIVASQLGDALGVTKGAGSNSVSIIINTLLQYENINWTAVLFTLLTIIISELISQNFAKIPGPFVALAISIASIYFFKLNVDTIGSKFGTAAFSLPHLYIPNFQLSLIKQVSSTAFAIAILCGIESLLTAVVIDGITGKRHNPNKELIGEGLANIITPLFGGIPTSGVIARSTTTVQNGGSSPIAPIAQAVFLFLVTFAFNKILAYIPLSALSGILFIVAYNMSGWKKIVRILASSLRDDKIILLVTLFMTIFVGLMEAIEIGIILSAFFFIEQNFRLAEADCQIFQPHSAPDLLLKEGGAIHHANNLTDAELEIPEDVTVFSLSGSLFFAAATKFDQVLRSIKTSSEYIIIRMDNIQTIDLSGINVLNTFLKDIVKNGQQLFVTEPNKYCKKLLLSGNFNLKHDQIFDTFAEAVKVINQTELAKQSKSAESSHSTQPTTNKETPDTQSAVPIKKEELTQPSPIQTTIKIRR